MLVCIVGLYLCLLPAVRHAQMGVKVELVQGYIHGTFCAASLTTGALRLSRGLVDEGERRGEQGREHSTTGEQKSRLHVAMKPATGFKIGWVYNQAST